MNTKTLVTLFLACILPLGNLKSQVIYELEFATNFDNREYAASSFSPSKTIFGLRATPYIGFKHSHDDTEHTFMGGLNIYHDFGVTALDILEHSKNISLWYNLDKSFSSSRFSIYAGVIPTKFVREYWSTAFISEEKRWYDPTFEGLLFALQGSGYNVELGCDWDGFYGTTPTTRESFTVFSAGHYDISSVFTGGYNAYMRHFACSPTVNGVVDNIMVEPYLKIDLGARVALDELELRLGYIHSLQRDRLIHDDFLQAGLWEFAGCMEKYNIRIDNRAYYGNNILPLYDKTDEAGIVYGSQLYHNDPFFALNGKFYDRLEIGYTPYLSKGIQFKIAAVFHFHSGIGLSGNQQIIALNFNIEDLL